MSVPKKGRLWFRWVVGIAGASLLSVLLFGFFFWILEIGLFVPRLSVDFPVSPYPLPSDFEQNHVLAWIGILVFVSVFPLFAVFAHAWRPARRISVAGIFLAAAKAAVVSTVVSVILVFGPFPVSWEHDFGIPVQAVIFGVSFVSCFFPIMMFPVEIEQLTGRRRIYITKH